MNYWFCEGRKTAVATKVLEQRKRTCFVHGLKDDEERANVKPGATGAKLFAVASFL